MLSNREKEIIRILYYYFNNLVYVKFGPSWLSKKDWKEMVDYIENLKGGHSINE